MHIPAKHLLIVPLALLCCIITTAVVKGQSQYQIAYSDADTTSQNLNFVRDIEQEPVSGDLFLMSWDELQVNNNTTTSTRVTRITSAGDTLWSRKLNLGIGTSFQPEDLAVYQTGFAIVGQVGDVDNEVYVSKFDLNGGLLWTKSYNGLRAKGTDFSQFYGNQMLLPLASGGFAFTANLVDSVTSNQTEPVLMITDPNGNIINSLKTDPSNSGYSSGSWQSLILTQSENIVASGLFTGDTVAPRVAIAEFNTSAQLLNQILITDFGGQPILDRTLSRVRESQSTPGRLAVLAADLDGVFMVNLLNLDLGSSGFTNIGNAITATSSSTNCAFFALDLTPSTVGEFAVIAAGSNLCASSSGAESIALKYSEAAGFEWAKMIGATGFSSLITSGIVAQDGDLVFAGNEITSDFAPLAMVLTKVDAAGNLSDECPPVTAPISSSQVSVTTLSDPSLEIQAPQLIGITDITSQITSTSVAVEQQVVCKNRRGLFPCETNFPGGGICRSSAAFDVNDSDYDKGLGITEDQNIGGGCVEVITICDDPSISYDIEAIMGFYKFGSPESVAPCGRWVVEQVPSDAGQGWTGASGVVSSVGSLQNLIQVNTLTFSGNPPGGTGGNYFTASSATFTPPGTLTQPLEVGVYLRRESFCDVCPTSPNGMGQFGDSRIRPVVFRILPRPTVNASVKQLTCDADQEVAFAIEIELVNPVSLFNSPDDASIFRASSLDLGLVPFTEIDINLFDGNGDPIGSIPNYTITQSSSSANIQNALNLISLPPGTSSAGQVQVEVEIRDANTKYSPLQTGFSVDGSLPDPGCTITLQVPFPTPVTIDAEFSQVSAIGPCQTGTGQSEISACVEVETNSGNTVTVEWLVQDNFGFTDIAAISTIAPGQSTVCITDSEVSLPGTPTFLSVIITDESTGCIIERTIELNVEGSTPGCVATTPSVILPNTASLINEAAFPRHDPQNNQNVIVVNPGSVSILEDAPILLVSCGDFVVDKDLTIRGGTIQVAEGARIIVEPGIEFTLQGTTIESCGDFLWEGIVSNRGNVNIVDSPNPNNPDETIRSNILDAVAGVQFNSSLAGGASAGRLLVRKSNFGNNFSHIRVQFGNDNVRVLGSRFTSNPLFFKSNPFNISRTGTAISFSACDNVVFGAEGVLLDDDDELRNSINEASTGVSSSGSDLEVWNTNFNGSQTNPEEPGLSMFFGVNVLGYDINNLGSRAIPSDVLVRSCDFNNVRTGVFTQQVTSLRVQRNVFTGTTIDSDRPFAAQTKGIFCTRLQWETINPTAPVTTRLDVPVSGLELNITENNSFTNLDFGVQIADCDAATIRIGDLAAQSSNTFTDCERAIDVTGSTTITTPFQSINPGGGPPFQAFVYQARTFIQDNVITRPEIGIYHARDSDVEELIISDNTITNYSFVGVYALGVQNVGLAGIGTQIERNSILNANENGPLFFGAPVNLGIASFSEPRSVIRENTIDDAPTTNPQFQVGLWFAASNASRISCNFINNQWLVGNYVQGPNTVPQFEANALGSPNIGQFFDSNGRLGTVGNSSNSSDNVWSSGSASFITSANTSPNHTRYFVSPTACQIPASFVFPGQFGVLVPISIGLSGSVVTNGIIFAGNCELDNCIAGSPGGVPAAGNTPISQQTEIAYEDYGEDLVTNQVQMNTLPQSTRAMERASLYDYMRARPSFGQFRWKLKLFRWLYQNQPGGRLWLADRLIARQRYFLAHAMLNNVNPTNPVDSTRKEVLSIKLEAAALNADTLTPQLRQDLMNLSMLCYNQFGQGVLEARASLGSVSDSTVVAWILADSCSGFLDVLHSTVANNGTRKTTFSTPENDPPVEQGIENLDQPLTVSFYPNPVATNLNIRFSDILSEGVLQLTDMSGKVVHTEQWQQSQTHQLDVSGIADGTYLVSITTGSGKQFVHKVTVKH